MPSVAGMLCAACGADSADLCGRTPQVQAAVLDEIADESITDCEDVTSGHLKEITVLRLGGKGITELQVGDFEGLDNLEALFLFKNPLETLPDGVFANLGNAAPSLFDGLLYLRVLSLRGNDIVLKLRS